MAKPYSQDLRDRVIDGEGARYGAAARGYAISEPAIKWLERVEIPGMARESLSDTAAIGLPS